MNGSPGTTTIATLSTHSAFGEMSFLGQRPRSSFAVAVADTRLDRIDGDIDNLTQRIAHIRT